MSVYYFLFSKGDKECVVLGKKLDADERRFEGPVVWIGAAERYLPKSLLDLLIKRYYEAHPDGDVLLLREDELFDSGEYLDKDEAAATLGGDADGDPPLSKYLPELDREDIKAEIIANVALKIS